MTEGSQLGIDIKQKKHFQKSYRLATPIEEKSIALCLARHEVMAVAQTGTAKTATFALPTLHPLSNKAGPGPKDIYALIMTSTREYTVYVAKI